VHTLQRVEKLSLSVQSAFARTVPLRICNMGSKKLLVVVVLLGAFLFVPDGVEGEADDDLQVNVDDVKFELGHTEKLEINDESDVKFELEDTDTLEINDESETFPVQPDLDVEEAGMEEYLEDDPRSLVLDMIDTCSWGQDVNWVCVVTHTLLNSKVTIGGRRSAVIENVKSLFLNLKWPIPFLALKFSNSLTDCCTLDRVPKVYVYSCQNQQVRSVPQPRVNFQSSNYGDAAAISMKLYHSTPVVH